VSTATFKFHPDLSLFLAPDFRDQAFAYPCARAATLKNAIEALGVPHTEVGEVRVNGEPATLQRIVRDGDVVEVGQWRSQEKGSDPIFLADAHLGGLARFLRMLGFDTVHENALDDAEICRLARQERRIVLTRDRELLKCREIETGCYVRALKPESQLAEVAARYGLGPRARPFTLCLRCNVPLVAVEKAAIAHRVPEAVLEVQESFSYCRGCDRVYWPGSHYQRMRQALKPIFSPA
jgi:uncharacterized protein with PIN domain/sulfur carrier protein ThiS